MSPVSPGEKGSICYAPRSHIAAYNAGLANRNMDEYKATSYDVGRVVKEALQGKTIVTVPREWL